MKTRIISTNKTVYYIIAILVIVIAFLLLGGGPWIKGLAHTHGSNGMANIRWAQVLIGSVIGFIIGLMASRRR